MQNTTDTTVLIVGSNGNAPGSQALKKAANSLGVAADIALVDSPETLERIQKATQVIYRLRPKSYDTFLVLSQKLTERTATYLYRCSMRLINIKRMKYLPRTI